MLQFHSQLQPQFLFKLWIHPNTEAIAPSLAILQAIVKSILASKLTVPVLASITCIAQTITQVQATNNRITQAIAVLQTLVHLALASLQDTVQALASAIATFQAVPEPAGGPTPSPKPTGLLSSVPKATGDQRLCPSWLGSSLHVPGPQLVVWFVQFFSHFCSSWSLFCSALVRF